jgi:hypothetical protein
MKEFLSFRGTHFPKSDIEFLPGHLPDIQQANPSSILVEAAINTRTNYFNFQSGSRAARSWDLMLLLHPVFGGK